GIMDLPDPPTETPRDAPPFPSTAVGRRIRKSMKTVRNANSLHLDRRRIINTRMIRVMKERLPALSPLKDELDSIRGRGVISFIPGSFDDDDSLSWMNSYNSHQIHPPRWYLLQVLITTTIEDWEYCMGVCGFNDCCSFTDSSLTSSA